MKKYNLLITLVISGVFLAVYCFQLKTSLFYHPDFARDMHEILRISQGKLTLIGPKLTFGGLYTGPYYFYLFVPAYILSGGQIISVHFFNALFFAAAVGFFLYKMLENKKYLEGILFSAVLAFLPLSMTGAKNPSNAYTFVPLFAMILTYLYFAKTIKPIPLLVLGFFYGVIINFHFINFAFFPFVFVYLFTKVKDKRQLVWFLVGIGVSFLPLILFEAKHNFVMLKNTFIDKSYLKWVNNTNIPGGLGGKKNVFANILFLSEVMKGYLFVNPLFIYFIIAVIFFFKKPDNKKK